MLSEWFFNEMNSLYNGETFTYWQLLNIKLDKKEFENDSFEKVSVQTFVKRQRNSYLALIWANFPLNFSPYYIYYLTKSLHFNKDVQQGIF